MRDTSFKAGQRGFTLVEAIMVIVITGIIGSMVAVFIRSPVDGYVDSVARAELTDAGDTALRRIARDVRTALPNSLRTASDGSSACFEFLPTVGGGRYRSALNDGGTGNVLDFTAAVSSFDALAGINLSNGAHHVVVYNLGIPGADAYAEGGSGGKAPNRARIANTSTAGGITTITLSSPNQFPFESPGKHFQVIPDYSVVYSCAGNALRRSTRSLSVASAGPLAACPAAGTTGESVLVDHVICDQAQIPTFNYAPFAWRRNGLLAITLVLTQPGARGAESISLYQEVHVDNSP